MLAALRVMALGILGYLAPRILVGLGMPLDSWANDFGVWVGLSRSWVEEWGLTTIGLILAVALSGIEMWWHPVKRIWWIVLRQKKDDLREESNRGDYSWAPLTNEQQTTLFSLLCDCKRHSIYIACGGGHCADLADTFHNVFNRLQWAVTRGTGRFDAQGHEGIVLIPCDDPAPLLQSAIESTTGFAVDVLSISREQAGYEFDTMLVIGAKPWRVKKRLSIYPKQPAEVAAPLSSRERSQWQLKCSEISIRDQSGEFFIRVKLTNTSESTDLTDVTPYLDEIDADDPLHEVMAVDFPVPIYSQQRLRDRIIARDSAAVPVKPIRIRAQQWKWLELFQITDVVERQAHIFLPGTRHDIMTLPIMEFLCSVYGAPGKIGFSVIYEEIEGGWQVNLVDELGQPSEPIRPERSDE